MNKSNTNNNNMIIITFFIIQANLYHWLPSLLQKSENACILHIKDIKIQKNYWLSLSSKIPTDNCFADQLLGDSKIQNLRGLELPKEKKNSVLLERDFIFQFNLCLNLTSNVTTKCQWKYIRTTKWHLLRVYYSRFFYVDIRKSK